MNYRLAVAIEENGNMEKVAENFGRCTKFNICELDNRKKILKTESFFNPLAGEHNGSCQLSKYINQYNVQTIIAGNIEQEAISKFIEHGINVVVAPGLPYENAVNIFIHGKLSSYEIFSHEGQNGNHYD